MNNELKNKILSLYPEYDTVTGPSIAKDNRSRIGLRNSKTGDKTVRQFAKVKLEVKINRRLSSNETVDHIDNDKTNDAPDNLQVLSRAENAKKGSTGNKFCLGYKQTEDHKRSGSKNGMARLDDAEVKSIREDFNSSKVTKKKLIADLNMNRRTVDNILKGISYVNAGGPIVEEFPKGRPKKSASGEAG